MKRLVLSLSLLAGAAPPAAGTLEAPASASFAEASPSAPAIEHSPTAPARHLGILEVPGPVPADLRVDVRPAGVAGFVVEARRPGHVVALRRADARATGWNQAELAVPWGGEATPIVWEATRLQDLVTTRGLVLLGDPARPRVVLAESPRVAGEEQRHLHACRAHEDAAAGFVVVCRVKHPVTAASLTGVTVADGVWLGAAPAGETAVRLDLPLSAGSARAAAIGYAAGVTGVVIRAEASLLHGEERSSLALASSSRAQVAPPPSHHWHRWSIMGDPIF